MADQEMLQAIRDLLTPINIRLENMENRLSGIEHEITGVKHDVSGLEHQMSNLRLEMHRGFRKNDDEIQTLLPSWRAGSYYQRPSNRFVAFNRIEV